MTQPISDTPIADEVSAEVEERTFSDPPSGDVPDERTVEDVFSADPLLGTTVTFKDGRSDIIIGGDETMVQTANEGWQHRENIVE